MKIKFLSVLKQYKDNILSKLTNKKGTVRGLAWSGISSLLSFSFFLLSYLANFHCFRLRTSVMAITMFSIEMFAYGFLLFSVLFPFGKRTKDWRATFGIGRLETFFLFVLSASYCMYPAYLFGLNLRDLSYNVAFIGMVLVEIAVVFYAAYDILNINNLRWFLRTWPYEAIGLLFILLLAHLQINNKHHNILLENSTLANTVLSFITITYFVQVFNERFCKKQDDRPKAGTITD